MNYILRVLALLWISHAASSGGMSDVSDKPANSSSKEFSVLLGGSYIPNAINGQTLQLLPYEIGSYADTFRNQSSGNAFTWGLEALYRFPLKNAFFETMGAGLQFFQITHLNQTGDVLQFGMPEFKNYTYRLGLNNIRFLANVSLNLHPVFYQIMPFVEAGIGGARTQISYESRPISPVVDPIFTLSNHASWNFAYQAGVGLKYPINTHLMASLRYLYANMGHAESSLIGSSTNLASPLIANMSTQNFVLGLTYRCN